VHFHVVAFTLVARKAGVRSVRDWAPFGSLLSFFTDATCVITPDSSQYGHRSRVDAVIRLCFNARRLLTTTRPPGTTARVSC
jgi:hypothetical protein